jgi:hypothetical protein
MGLIVGSARIDENGRITGGAAGDQTGIEVSKQPYYMHSKGWICIRPKSVQDANKIASAMNDACDNNNIGYDQNGRYGIVNKVKECGAIKKISVPTEADCSSTIRACCIEAFGTDPGDFSTANEAYVLGRTGKFEPAFAVTSSTELFNGDILVTKTKGHTVAVVSGNPRPTTPAKKSPVANPTLRFGSEGAETKKLQKNLNKLKFKDSEGKKLVTDGEFGRRTGESLRKFQKKYKLEVDGIYGPKSYAQMKKLIK